MPFDVQKPPLYRVEIIETPECQFFCLIYHHLLFDGISVQLALYFVDFSTNNDFNDREFALIQDKIDSLRNVKKPDIKQQIYPFNPNYLTDFKAYQLGLNTEQIDRLLAFREKGKFVNSAEEFQIVSGVNDSLIQVISSYFKFPDWTKKKITKKIKLSVISSLLNGGVKAPLRALDTLDDINF